MRDITFHSAHPHNRNVPVSRTVARSPVEIHDDPVTHWSDRWCIESHERYRPFDPQDRLHVILADVAERAGMQLPRIYENTRSFYAHTSGIGKRGVFHVNTPEASELSDAAVKALFAHELSHIKNGHARLGGALAVLAATALPLGSCAILLVTASASYKYVAATLGSVLLFPILALVAGRITSRTWEREADFTAREILGGASEQVAVFVEMAKNSRSLADDLTPDPKSSFRGELLNTRTHPSWGSRLLEAVVADGGNREDFDAIVREVKAPIAQRGSIQNMRSRKNSGRTQKNSTKKRR